MGFGKRGKSEMNLRFKYLLAYLSIPFFVGLFFINVINFNKANIGGATTTLSHTNDVIFSTVCSAHSGEINSIGVQSSVFWEARVATNSPWLRVLDPVTGSGDGFVHYQVETNYTGSPRTGVITIDGQEFTVIQKPFDESETCSAEPDVPELRASSDGLTTEIRINDWGLNLNWKILVREADWILPDRISGRGAGAASLYIAQNAQPVSRMTVVVIGRKIIPIIQDGAPRER